VYATFGRLQESGTVRITAAPEAGSPAFVAGLRDGDVISAIDGAPMKNADEVRSVLRGTEPGSTLQVTVQRGAETLEVAATLVQNPGVTDAVAGYLGVRLDSLDRVQLSPTSAIGTGVSDLTTGLGQAVKGIIKIVNPVNVFGHLMGTNDDPTSRPTTLVGATRISEEVGFFDGWAGVLGLLAALNLSVGVFNMLPLLPLDGGHAAIATYERIRSRKGQRYTADVAKLMPVVAATVMVLAFMFLTGLYLDTVKPIR
jgi:membrane-associated protease RseP (regulator of RpoE activity)